MRTKLILLGSAIALAASPAIAADADKGTGFYIGLTAGSQSTKNLDGTIIDEPGAFGGSAAAANDTIAVKFKTKSSFAPTATLGYDFGMIRADIGVTYSKGNINGAKITAISGTAVTGLTDEDAQDFCDYLSEGAIEQTCTIADGNTVTGTNFGKLRQVDVLASVWVDIPTGMAIEPYVGVGIGASGFHVETAADDDGKVGFAWQAGAGVAYKLSPTVALTVDYRYRQSKGALLFADEGFGLKIGKLKTSLFSAGVRFTF